MTRTVLTITAALVAIAAIIALDAPQPAVAQSDDDYAGRIVARRLADGRVEFGWQPTGEERVLPRLRYFPTNAQVDRWLRSSPVEVGGVAIGRINARLLSDGRIEFAFTPTDGERILTRARYFPSSAQVNRWLRSTEITTSAAAPGFIAVSVGNLHTCAIRKSGAIECWGGNHRGQINNIPEGRFTAVSTHNDYNCGLRSDGAIKCWGHVWGKIDTRNYYPEGSFTEVSNGGDPVCAIRESGAIACWGNTEIETGRDEEGYPIWGDGGQINNIPEGRFATVSTGYSHTCAIRDDGAIECWLNGNRGGDNRVVTDAPSGSFTAISAGWDHTCAIRESGAIECWGYNNYNWQNTPPAGTPPAGSFTAVSAYHLHTCAIRESGEIECWGGNDVGQSTPPTN